MTDRSLVQIALYAAVIAALGFLPPVAIPLLGGVPITAQSLGIMLAGVMLGPVRGAASVLLFLAVVALGAPLLSGGRGGLSVFAGPTVGFLIGWPIAAFVTGAVMQITRSWRLLFASFIASALGGIVVLYGVGVPVLAAMIDKPLLATFVGSAIFVPGDILKAAVVAVIAETVAKGMPRAIRSRA